MSRLCVAPIVEGHGEVAAVPVLLRRIATEMLTEVHLDVLRPFRVPRSKLIKRRETQPQVIAAEVQRAVQFASLKLGAASEGRSMSLVLFLLDSNGDCPARLGPEICSSAEQSGVACVLATVEYETWFAAAAESLAEMLDLADGLPNKPEEQRCGKTWIMDRFRGARYSETLDQARMTARMDLGLCRQRSPSFDKLCRVIEHLAELARSA